MVNTFKTASVPALTAMAILENNKVMTPLVNTGYVDEAYKKFNGYNRGNTIPINLPPTFSPEIWNGSHATEQAITETQLTVTLSDLVQVPFGLTASDSTFMINALKPDGTFPPEFFARVIVPLMESLANYEDKYILTEAYKATPFYYGVAGTTPDGVDDMTGIRELLNNLKCPNKNRSLVMDTAADKKMLELDTFHEADKAGSTQAQQEAMLGRKFGFGVYSDQNVAYHTKGTLAPSTAAKGIQVKGAVASGATSMTLDSVNASTLTGTLVAGDILKFTDASTSLVSYSVVTAGSSADSNEIAVTCTAPKKILQGSGAVAVGLADNSTVELIGSHRANLAFNKDSIIHVSVPMAVGREGYIIQNPYTGQGISITESGYSNATKTHSWCAQFYVDTIARPEGVVRLLG